MYKIKFKIELSTGVVKIEHIATDVHINSLTTVPCQSWQSNIIINRWRMSFHPMNSWFFMVNLDKQISSTGVLVNIFGVFFSWWQGLLDRSRATDKESWNGEGERERERSDGWKGQNVRPICSQKPTDCRRRKEASGIFCFFLCVCMYVRFAQFSVIKKYISFIYDNLTKINKSRFFFSKFNCHLFLYVKITIR